MEHLAGALSAVDRSLALSELFALRMAAVFHSAATLVHTRAQADMKAAMVRELYPLLFQKTKDREQVNTKIAFLNERYKSYLEAFYSPPEGKNGLFVVGSIFAAHCGLAQSMDAILIASIEFPGCLMQLVEVYRAFQELPGGDVIVLKPEPSNAN
jgi:hypothetical protein